MDRLSIAEVGSEACSLAPAPPPTAQLPWWKLILVDTEYRARVMQLATRGYRQELRLLQRAPEQLSSAAGKKEGGTVRVMAQYVRVKSGELFSLNHPRAIVKHSTLATRLQAALCTMPPVQNKKERQQQMRAIEAQFRQRRRYSLQHAPTQRVCDARAILAGQTTLDEVRGGGQRGPYLLSRAELARRRQLYHAWRVRMRALYKETNYYAVARYKLQEEQRCGGLGQARPLLLPLLSKEDQELYVFPAPSPNARRRRVQIIHHGLPPETNATLTAATINVLAGARRVNQAAQQPPSSVRSLLDSSDSDSGIEGNRSRATSNNHSLCLRGIKGGDESNHSSCSDDDEADPKTSAMVAEYRRHAALACVDGTDNLYGLSYFWKLPLPPAGFIRVSPDPRQAMWPNEQLEAKRQAREERRRRDMQSLMHKVNERNRRIMTLRQYGCQITINMLRDSSDEDDVGEAGKVREGALGLPSQSNSTRASPEEEWRELLIGPARGNTAAAASAGGLARSAKLSSPAFAPQADASNGNNNNDEDDMDQDVAHVLRPLYEGPLNINVVLDADGEAQRKLFLGTFRQSKLLVHYKIYCRALHAEVERRAEQRCRRGPHAAHTGEEAEGAEGEERVVNDEALLAGVPVIPFPVLRVQESSPPLRRHDRLHTPDLSRVQPARCWEGLMVCPPPYRTTTAQHVWRYLHAVSAMTQQAVRDVFDCLALDQEGRLQRGAYIEFVLDLLHLFFPTHLHQVHRAIAEEEWVYRGCSETVAFPTFYEHFFSFPFIFMRDVATMTEQAYVEFWSLVRICLFENDPLPPVLPRKSCKNTTEKKADGQTSPAQATNDPTLVPLTTATAAMATEPETAVQGAPQDSLRAEDAHNRTLVYNSLTAMMHNNHHHNNNSLVQQQQQHEQAASHAPHDEQPFAPTPTSCSLSISAQYSSRQNYDTPSLPLSTVPSSQQIPSQRQLHSARTPHQYQQQQQQQQRPSLLVPLTGFTERQIAALYHHRYRNDDKYTLYCLMAELAEKDPVVRQLPESSRYRVLLDRARKQLRKEHKKHQQQEEEEGEAMHAEGGQMATVASAELREKEMAVTTSNSSPSATATSPSASRCLTPALVELKDSNSTNNNTTTRAQPGAEDALAPHVLPYRAIALAEEAHEDDAHGLPHGRLDEAESVSRRSKLAFATERRRAQLRRREEERRRAFLLANSLWYQSRHRRQQSRHDTTVTGIESLSSNWELFEDDVFYLTPPTDDAEDALIHYIRDVDEEVFRGNISLRERYMVSEAYKRERVKQHHALHDKAFTSNPEAEEEKGGDENAGQPAVRGDEQNKGDDATSEHAGAARHGAEALDQSPSTPTTMTTTSMLSFPGSMTGHGHMMGPRELVDGLQALRTGTKPSRLAHRVVHFAHDADEHDDDVNAKTGEEEGGEAEQRLALPAIGHGKAAKQQSAQERGGSSNNKDTDQITGEVHESATTGEEDEASVYTRVPRAVRGLLTQLASEDTTMPWRAHHNNNKTHREPQAPDVAAHTQPASLASRDALRRLRCRQQRERAFVQQRLSARSGAAKAGTGQGMTSAWAGYNVFRRDTVRL